MPFTSLKFKPGIVSDITSYSNEGGFVDSDKVRFRLGFPEKIGGWVKANLNTYLGTARSLHNWVALDSSDYLGVGTNLKYYIEEGGTFNDITPNRATTTNGILFSATNGSATITATDSSHGAVVGDFVTISGAASLGGAITAAVLNQEHQVVSVANAANFTFVASATANSSDTGTGGSGVDGVYQVNTGTASGTSGTGWGAGLWGGMTTTALQTQLNEALDNSETAVDVDDETGITTAGDIILVDNELMLVAGDTDNDTLNVTRGHSGTTAVAHDDNTLVRLVFGNANASDDFVGWGEAAVVTVSNELRVWTHDNFGEDLLINARNGGIYYWDKSDGLTTRAVEISTESGASNTPTVAKQILVSDQDRHVIAFGANTLGTTIQDPLLIRFSSQESLLDWTPTATNTAGDLRLGGGSTFMQAVETKQGILVFTDKTLHAMKFIGPPFTFGLQELSKNITMMSSRSATAVDDLVFWMGIDNFYIYAGQTQPLPCTVKEKVFLDFNFEQRDKVHAGVNTEFSEITWFYPTASSSEIDAYVSYNYTEKVWYYGTLSRTAWQDRGIRTLPQATGEGFLYNHETGFDDDGSAMTSFIESAPIDVGDGDKFSFIKRVIPDITFNGSTSLNPTANFTIKAKDFPGSTYDQTSTQATTRSSTSPVEQFTSKLDYRIRGRSFALRIDSSALGTKYKLGTPRIDIREDGRR
tara:strand:+ start:527 stop:2626 length:2100 start_codon:yes stop_codon:yes gene_type:complete